MHGGAIVLPGQVPVALGRQLTHRTNVNDLDADRVNRFVPIPPRRLAFLEHLWSSTRAARGDSVVAPGEMHGLVGQNGCGKSTPVKILTGVYTPDPGGSVRVDGQVLHCPSTRPPACGGSLGPHQTLGLVDDRTVWENVRSVATRPEDFFHKIASGPSKVRDVLARLGRSLDIDQPVGHLSAEDRAAVAIARALQDHRPGGGLIIFDESTRALGREARARFYSLVDWCSMAVHQSSSFRTASRGGRARRPGHCPARRTSSKAESQRSRPMKPASCGSCLAGTLCPMGASAVMRATTSSHR